MDDVDLRGSPQQGLVTATFGFFIGFAGVVLYGPIAPQFGDAMGLSGVLLGLLVAAPQLSGSLLRIPFGAWTDDVGAKLPFLILLVLSIIGMSGLAVILLWLYPDGLTYQQFPLVFLFGCLSGCGIAVFSIGSAQTSYWYPTDRQGTALAIYAGLGNSSPGVATLIVPVVITALGITQTYLLWLGLLVVGTLVFAYYAVDPYYFQLRKQGVDAETAKQRAETEGQELFPSGNAMESIRNAARIRRVWALVAMFFVSFGGFLALSVWLPSYWIELHGLNIRSAGVVTAITFVLAAALIRVPGGWISDTVGGEPTAIVSFGAIGCGSILLVWTRDLGTAMAATFLLAVGMGVANAAVFQLVPKYVPEAVGGASGLVGGLGAFGGFAVPPLLGLFVDIYGIDGYATGFVTYLVLGVGGMILASRLYRTVDQQPGTPAVS
ncbi:MFS transporter [Halonotius roseus]|uniref:MFS transporter n=1 Tax=Halonotius roseus TaxID=2511997 RepID=A0A544QP92_9EURY|nr:MFS transporter [Halonotius roseus]TQQ80704.1 MFS transporter [Halonotius roseus]